jgi:hypothetical protein
MNIDLKTRATLLIRFLALTFLASAFLEAATLTTNYVMVWVQVFPRDEVAVRARIIEMAFQLIIFASLYFKGTNVAAYLADSIIPETAKDGNHKP